MRKRPPRRRKLTAATRRSPLQSDNLALVPASDLASLAMWQYRARLLPAGRVLLVIPHGNPRLQLMGNRIKATLRRQGGPVIVTTIHGR